MGWLSGLWGKHRAIAAEGSLNAPPFLPELQLAASELQAGNNAAALEQALPYAEAANPTLRVDANRICALALSREWHFHEAYVHWLRLFEQESTAHNALQLATTSVMCGEVDRGEAWLFKFHQINRRTREIPTTVALINFISALTLSARWRVPSPIWNG